MPDANLPPELRSGVPAMDALHQAFLASLNALADVPDREFETRYADFVRQAEVAFSTEEAWMEERDLPFLQSHREQHARVLSGLHHAWAAVDEGDLEQGRHALTLLPQWLLFHQATMDLALAAALELVQRQPN